MDPQTGNPLMRNVPEFDKVKFFTQNKAQGTFDHNRIIGVVYNSADIGDKEENIFCLFNPSRMYPADIKETMAIEKANEGVVTEKRTVSSVIQLKDFL